MKERVCPSTAALSRLYYCVISTKIFLQSLNFLLDLATSIIPVPTTNSLQHKHSLFIDDSGTLRSMVLLKYASKTDTFLIKITIASPPPHTHCQFLEKQLSILWPAHGRNDIFDGGVLQRYILSNVTEC